MKKFFHDKVALKFDFDELFDYSNNLETGKLFFCLNQTFPNTINFTQSIVFEKYLDAITKHYELDQSNIWTNKSYLKDKKKYTTNQIVIYLRDELILSHSPGETTNTILYADNVSAEEIDFLIKTMSSYVEKVKAKSRIHLLYQADNRFFLKDFDVKKIKLDIKTNYNDDFAGVNTTIIKRLNKKNDKGIVMLYGVPGTGKTNYIRFLTSKINKKLIYIPPEFTHKIASPDFLPFLMSHPNSVLILEDAENIVVDRESGTNDSISNLLNLADGLLADCLNIQIVCTFNTNITKIDQALLRKGRLIAMYEFSKLEANKAQVLSDKLGFNSKINTPYTLAEIYNQDETLYEKQDKTPKIGF